MAIPNPEIYGAAETWQNAYNASGINSEEAETLKCGKIKIPNFSTGTGTYITSQLRTAVSNDKITENEPIDNTICAVGQGNKSPYKEIACHYYDEDSNTWYGPYITNIDIPVNMFPYETYSANGLQGINGGFTNLNFAPLSSGQAQIWSENGVEIKYYNGNPLYYNANWRLAPYTSYQLKSIVLQIYVNYTTNTSEPMTDAGLNEDHWITLENWKNTYNQYPIVGSKVRMISAYQISGDNIEYYNYVGENNPPYRSAFGLGLNHPIIHNGSGDTFLSYTTFKSLQIDSDVIIFNKCYNLGGWGKYSKLCLPMWDRFSAYLQKPSNKAVLYRIPYSDTVYEELMKAVSSLGFCFTPTAKTSFNVNFTDSDMCIPVIDDNGITTGEYTRGSDNINNDLYNADSVRDKGYNPDTPIDPNTYSDTTNWNTVNFQSAFCKRYELTAAQVGQLASELWAAQAAKPADIDFQNYSVDEYLTNNPIDTIVSLKYFPCVVETAANPAVVHLGKYQTNIAANAISHTIKVIDFDPINVFPHFEDFRDYEPYTTLQMYVPFCGTVSIPTAEAMGKYVSVKLCIDINTGACAGYIIVSSTGTGGICVATATGTASIDIPVSGLQSANIDQAVFNATANWTQTQISNGKIMSGMLTTISGQHRGIAGSVAGLSRMGITAGSMFSAASSTGGKFSLLDKLNPMTWGNRLLQEQQTEKRAKYELQHIEMPMRLIGSTSPALSSVIESSCRLIIYRPITDEGALSHYADTVGFATVSSGTVSQFSGYTEGTIDVSGINATAEEKAEIQSLFASGVYL